MTRSWLVRLGKFGEQEAHALETGELVLGWALDDIRGAQGREEILAKLEVAEPNQKPKTLENWAVQLNQFSRDISVGDLVIVPMKTTSQVAIGRVIGLFKHAAGGHVARDVEWLRTDVPRTAIKQDLVYSLGALPTRCEDSRNEPASRTRR